MSPLKSFLIGEFDREEFAAARELLRRRSRLVMVPTVSQACALLGPTAGSIAPWMIPDLIVLAQSRPGQFTTGQIERLRCAAPLARVVGLLGSWCEGESRTGRPWPAAVRCYWYDWVPRLSRELDRHDAGLGAMWSLPDTVSPEELWDWLTAVDSPSRGGRILICTRSWDLADALREACHEQGYVTEVVRPTDGSWTRGKPTPAGDRFIVAIWEGTQCSPEEVDQLRQLTRDFPGTPILALLDFPRTQNLQQAEKAGAACVISKPFLLVDLFALVRQHAIKYDEPCRGVESAAASTID